MISLSSELELKRLALRIRAGIVEAIGAKGGGHIGGSLDLAELLAVLYGGYLRVRPEEPDWEGRDFLIFSKGHAGPALYSILAIKGFFPYERLSTLNKAGTLLPGHCDRLKVPGVDATTGSLGQGLSIACGAALGFKLAGTGRRVYCITGDGESAEGQIWEAAQYAAHCRLDNLIAFLDWNKMQIDGSNDEVMGLRDPVKKYEAFGWNTRLVDGSSVAAISAAVKRAVEEPDGRPSMIVLDTVKGAGVPCVAEMSNNHCIAFPKKLYEESMASLRKQAEELGVEL